MTYGRMYFVTGTISFFASHSFSRDVLFHFSVLYLGLILPKYALLGVFDLFGYILRMDNHSSQFDGLWSGYLDTTFNERPVTWEA